MGNRAIPLHAPPPFLRAGGRSQRTWPPADVENEKVTDLCRSSAEVGGVQHADDRNILWYCECLRQEGADGAEEALADWMSCRKQANSFAARSCGIQFTKQNFELTLCLRATLNFGVFAGSLRTLHHRTLRDSRVSDRAPPTSSWYPIHFGDPRLLRSIEQRHARHPPPVRKLVSTDDIDHPVL